MSPFVCPQGDKHFSYTGGDKHFSHTGRDKQGGGTFSVGGVGGKDDVDGAKEEDVSEANTLASEASNLSAGARILRGPYGPEVLVLR